MIRSLGLRIALLLTLTTAAAARPQAESRREKSPGPPPQSKRIADMEAELLRRINTERKQRDLPALEVVPVLSDLARDFSRRMAEQGFFSHTAPNGETLAQRIRRAGLGLQAYGENLFETSGHDDPVPVAVQGWMKSPGHRANILRAEFTQTGLGIWRRGRTYTLTQEFARPWR